MSTITDRSPGKGVYQGDLAYGRADGQKPVNGKDFVACYQEDGKPKNQPCCKLVLQGQRDPEVWTRDPNLKEAKTWDTSGNQHATNVLLVTYRNSYDHLKANFHLTIGRKRF